MIILFTKQCKGRALMGDAEDDVKRKIAWLVFIVTACVAMLVPMTASAATESDLEVQVWPAADPTHVVVIVGSKLSDSVKLPAKVRLPIVDGMQVTWAGEVFYDGSHDDIERQYKVVHGSGGDYAEFEVQDSRDGQIELAGPIVTEHGNLRATNVDFVQTTPEKATVAFSARLPRDARKPSITPAPAGPPSQNSSTGETLYTLPSKVMSPGDSSTVSLTYQVALQPSQQPAVASKKAVTVALFIVLGLAVAALVIVLVSRRSAPSGGGD